LVRSHSAEKPSFMLRESQHERKIVSRFNAIPVRPEPSRRANKGFSVESLLRLCPARLSDQGGKAEDPNGEGYRYNPPADGI
jgi:hypothetical protein